MQHLQKTGGWGSRLAHPTRMRILSDYRESKDSSPADLSLLPFPLSPLYSHSFAQRTFVNSFGISWIRTLSLATEGVPAQLFLAAHFQHARFWCGQKPECATLCGTNSPSGFT